MSAHVGRTIISQNFPLVEGQMQTVFWKQTPPFWQGIKAQEAEMRGQRKKRLQSVRKRRRGGKA
jgi:hypothetical protein